MARFIVLWVPDNSLVTKVFKKVTKWQDKIPIKVVGEFMDPRNFCDKSCGRQSTEGWQKNNPLIVHPRWGTKHCPLCKKIVPQYAHYLTNGLEPMHLPFYMRTLALTLYPPGDNSLYDGRSVEEIYGEDKVIEGIAARRQTLALAKSAKTTQASRASARARRRRSRQARSASTDSQVDTTL